MKRRKKIADVRVEMYEEGQRDALVGVCNVMRETATKVKEGIPALDVRAAIDSFANQFISFIENKLYETQFKEGDPNGRVQ